MNHYLEALFGPLEIRLVAFIDILGWGNLTSSIASEVDLRKPLKAMAYVQSAAKTEENRKAQFSKIGIPAGRSIRSSHFSDTIVYSCAAERDEAPWLVFQVGLVCSFLLEQRLYTQGAITVGGLLHDDTRIMGEALVRAHLLEKSVACYPRLIVSDEAAPYLVAPVPRAQDPSEGPSQVRTDHDGLRYLDIFPTWTAGRRSPHVHEGAVKARAVAERDFEKKRDLSIEKDKVRALKHRAIYGWMLDYLDGVLADPVESSPEEEPQIGPLPPTT